LETDEAETTRNYLDGRLNMETQDLFGFGYFSNANQLSLLTSHIAEDILLEEKLMYRRDMTDAQSARSVPVLFFENHPIIIPYRNVYGKAIALVGRSLLNDKEREAAGISKYKNTVFKKSQHLFGLYEAKTAILDSGFVYVVEGQFDVIKAFEKGIKNIVAVGNSNLSGYQVGLLCRYTQNIVLLFDNDEAGQIGSGRAIYKFSKHANILNKVLPTGYKDIDDYLGENSANDLMHNLALPFTERFGHRAELCLEFSF
jgi:DNA primase catalytic core